MYTNDRIIYGHVYTGSVRLNILGQVVGGGTGGLESVCMCIELIIQLR